MKREILKEKSTSKNEVQDSYISLINDINMLDTENKFSKHKRTKPRHFDKENIPNNISPTEDLSTQLSHINLSHMLTRKRRHHHNKYLKFIIIPFTNFIFKNNKK